MRRRQHNFLPKLQHSLDVPTSTLRLGTFHKQGSSLHHCPIDLSEGLSLSPFLSLRERGNEGCRERRAIKENQTEQRRGLCSLVNGIGDEVSKLPHSFFLLNQITSRKKKKPKKEKDFSLPHNIMKAYQKVS